MIDQSLIASLRAPYLKDTVTTPICERCAIRTDESYPHFWDQNEIVELIYLREYERYKDFKDELG